ncbi:MAG: SEC-C domain-containing protein [Candidatus Vogelbacteria bacterium]|nr:SEC-C domain-containing protein [Candidatus Vogelbacteria bacterium]
MADQTMYEKLKASCPCGSGKSYVECCGRGEPCPCGSGKKAIDCCFVNPETHDMNK